MVIQLLFLDICSSIDSIQKYVPFLLGPEAQEFLISPITLRALACACVCVRVTSAFVIEINITFRSTVSENGREPLWSVLVCGARGLFRKTPEWGRDSRRLSGGRTSQCGAGWRESVLDFTRRTLARANPPVLVGVLREAEDVRIVPLRA